MMMDEILFRGKRLSDGKWISGILINYESGLTMIIPKTFSSTSYAADDILVNYRTVGLFTGEDDAHGNKIYHGDILDDGSGTCGFKVLWEGFGFVAQFHLGNLPLRKDILKGMIVVGNIFDNPNYLV